jgi:hypothetical protein
MPSFRLAVLGSLLGLAACAEAPTGITHRLTSGSLAGGPPFVVAFAGAVAGDVGPPLGSLELTIRAQATGPNGSLAGSGGHEAFFGLTLIERSQWTLTSGFIDDAGSAMLQGAVSRSTAPGLVNAPLSIHAEPNGAISVTFGPIPGGPFAGNIQTFTGSGVVTISQP